MRIDLNERQRQAVECTEGPLIVLAGAGSGKTKMLTSRICHLIEDLRVPAYQILAVTFTNKAAAEMRERVEKQLREAGVFGSPEIGTFHSVCIRLLRRELMNTPFTKPFVIYDDSDQLSLVKSSLRSLDIDEKKFNPKAIQGRINRAKCDAQEPADMEVAPHDIFGKVAKRVYEQYQKDLFANNALDFGEIICMAYRILRDHADIRAKYQRLYRYIHVDEYQDTNRSQYLLLSAMAGKSFGGHQNICVVGDEDQSIYKWRGADIRNILDFESDYPGAQLVKLEQNYRSTQTILNVAGNVIQNNQSRKDKRLWTENEKGRPVIRAQLPDEKAEAEMVVDEIKRLAQSDSRAFGDFAIFYRTNAQSRQFEEALRREKMPYQLFGGLRFYDRKEIKDILAYFKLILNPSDSISLKRIINVPARGIGKTTLDKLDQLYFDLNQIQPTTFWDVVCQAANDPGITSAGTARKLAAFVTTVQLFITKQPHLMLSELYHLILDETGYVRELQSEATEEAQARIENLKEFDTSVQEFEEDNLKDIKPEDLNKKKFELLPLFIEQSSLVSEGDDHDPTISSVKMMTLHSSKGLEFPVVFMVGMEEGLFPSHKPWEETPEEDIEEERRLCYVGITRAREVLYLMSVIVRRIWGNVSYQEASRFFTEMPDELIELRDFSYGNRASQFRPGSSSHFSGSSSSRPYESPRYGSHAGHGGSSSSGSSSGITDYIGRQMNHPEYGKGTVVGSEGSGSDQKVLIKFAQNGQKKFVLKYVMNYFAN